MRNRRNLSLVFANTFFVPAVMSAQAADMVPTHSSMTARDSAALRSLLTSPLGSRGPSGSAVVIGKTLRIEWAGDQPGSARTWSVRRGSCARDEGAWHASTELTPLTIDAAGKAETSAELGVPMPLGKAYLVVYQSSSGSEPVVLACGALSNGAAVEDSDAAMDHSAMAHSAMVPFSKDLPKTDPSKTDHWAMDHSGMAMGTVKAGGERESAGLSRMDMAGSSHDSVASGLMAIHERMMADPVIRERVRTDPVLQRMINELHTDLAKMRLADPTVAPKTPTAKSTPKRAAASKPVVKPTPKTAAPAMPGMDHSQMPGMKKPPS